jgi:hypothetical protein
MKKAKNKIPVGRKQALQSKVQNIRLLSEAFRHLLCCSAESSGEDPKSPPGTSAAVVMRN